MSEETLKKLKRIDNANKVSYWPNVQTNLDNFQSISLVGIGLSKILAGASQMTPGFSMEKTEIEKNNKFYTVMPRYFRKKINIEDYTYIYSIHAQLTMYKSTIIIIQMIIEIPNL